MREIAHHGGHTDCACAGWSWRPSIRITSPVATGELQNADCDVNGPPQSGPTVTRDNPAEPDLGEVMSANMCVRPTRRVADRDGRYRVGWDRSCRTNQSDAPTVAGTTTTLPRISKPAPMFAPMTGSVATA